MDIRPLENELDKALLQVGKYFYEATVKADEDYAQSANTTMETYRKTRESIRVKYEQTLKQAETDFNTENALSLEVFNESPVKAKADYETAKKQAREVYEKRKSELFDKHNNLLAELAKQEVTHG